MFLLFLGFGLGGGGGRFWGGSPFGFGGPSSFLVLGVGFWVWWFFFVGWGGVLVFFVGWGFIWLWWCLFFALPVGVGGLGFFFPFWGFFPGGFFFFFVCFFFWFVWFFFFFFFFFFFLFFLFFFFFFGVRLHVLVCPFPREKFPQAPTGLRMITFPNFARPPFPLVVADGNGPARAVQISPPASYCKSPISTLGLFSSYLTSSFTAGLFLSDPRFPGTQLPPLPLYDQTF